MCRQRKEHGEPVGNGGMNPEGLRDVRGERSWGRLGLGGCPWSPKAGWEWRSQRIQAPRDGADPAGRVLAKADGRYGTGTLRDLCYAH